jgi:hypothetical protein
MKKQVFYLKDEVEFYETESDVITWVFRYNGQTAYSKALHELIELNYNEN